MPIGTAAWDKTEEIGKRSEAIDVLGKMARVPHLDSVQSRFHERLETRAAAVASRVRPDCEPAGLMRYRDRVPDLQSLLGNESRSAAAEVAIESLAKIAHESGANKRAGDMRSTYRGIARFLHYHIYRQIEPERPEALHNPRRAHFPSGAKRLQARFEDSEPGDMKSEDVNLTITFVRTQLDSGNDAQTQRFARGGCEGKAGKCVVIGDRQRAEPYIVRGSHHRIWRKRPVGRRRV